MLEIIIAALLALGIISSPGEATLKDYNNNKAAVDTYIIDNDLDQI